MPHVSVTINGRAYSVACEAGQEARIERLALEVDERVQGFVRQVGQAGEARLLVLAALVIADELAEARGAASPDEGRLAAGLERLAQRIEAVASRLASP
jgi:cell division protein ZapA